MKRAEAKTRTFNQILKRLETQNAERLIERARTANRLAKSAPDSRARRRAYRVKVGALINLRRRFPAPVSRKIRAFRPSSSSGMTRHKLAHGAACTLPRVILSGESKGHGMTPRTKRSISNYMKG